jgi:CubicO group peptidase (beta-lactamase class C family)
MSISPTGPKMRAAGQAPPGIDEADLTARVAGVLGRWPSAGLAVGVVREGSLAWFLGHGVADVRSKAPITEDTVFRIGSLTKTFTAIAVMQLWEQGLVDLDAPANDYLRSFQLVPAKASFRPATVRHLLTHTAGVGYWRRLSDLIRPGVGSGDRAGRSGAPPLADYYRKGLPVEVEPGTKWVYSNHGFAVLGQIVEGVSGQSLDRYLRDHIFEPLGMEHTDLIRSGRVRPRLATGYVLRPGGLEPVADREVPTPGGGGMYSTAGDMARYVAALLRMGAGEHGSVLKPATVASMFQPHFQPDPRAPGMGWPSSPARRAVTRPSAKPASCPASSRRWCWLPMTGSACSRSATPEASAAAARRRPSRRPSSGACSAFPIRRSAPASRPAPKPGANCAGGTAPIPARSPICSPERSSAPEPRSPFTAAT